MYVIITKDEDVIYCTTEADALDAAKNRAIRDRALVEVYVLTAMVGPTTIRKVPKET